MPEIPGGFTSDWRMVTHGTCPKCRSDQIAYRLWESSDEAYEDYRYRCLDCGHDWWVDGIDS
jgi:DNA-directed RNA polymerase subunit M/transcription elongation factor TFIIS